MSDWRTLLDREIATGEVLILSSTPNGAPDEMKLGTAMSLLHLLIFEVTSRGGRSAVRQ